MMDAKITISEPTAQRKDAFLHMLDDYDAHDPQNGKYYAPARENFTTYVISLHDEERGISLWPGAVPCSHRWLLDESDAVVGIVRIRHNISTPFLAAEGGHIGYDVAPAARNQGYGTECLRAGLTRARELGLGRVLVCADAANPASWRAIERCGGVLEREFHSEQYQCMVRRYWINIVR